MTERQETLLRILNLMQQGLVTPEEAADLIDAIYEPAQSAPPPESAASQTNGNGSANPARGLLDQILRTVEETVRATGQAVRSVNWQQIGQSVREQTQRGLDELRKTLEELEKGDWSLDGGANTKPTCTKRWTSRLMGGNRCPSTSPQAIFTSQAVSTGDGSKPTSACGEPPSKAWSKLSSVIA